MDFIQLKLDWPLAFKLILLKIVRTQLSDEETKLNHFADFVLNPTKNLKKEISKVHLFFGFAEIKCCV